jgi:hypothetical protein
MCLFGSQNSEQNYAELNWFGIYRNYLRRQDCDLVVTFDIEKGAKLSESIVTRFSWFRDQWSISAEVIVLPLGQWSFRKFI